MNKIYYITLLYIYVSLLTVSCSTDDTQINDGRMPMRFVAIHPSSNSRVGNTGFENGDEIGLYVCPDTALLQIAGNIVNNEPLRYDGMQWNARRQLYWDEGKYNIRAYYPYSRVVESVEDYAVSVATDQSQGAYEASDLLYARVDNVEASDVAVPLRFVHAMSRIVIRLIKGDDFEGELPKKVDVYVHNTVTEATLNMHNGIVTKSIKAGSQSIRARQESDYTYAAIVVPQRIPNSVPLLEVDVNGMSYLSESSFVFKAGTQHVVNFIIDKNPNRSQITVRGEVAGW